MNAHASRSVLLLCRAPPHGSGRARDALDVAMAFGAFEQRVSLLLIGDAVLMLVPPASGAAVDSVARLAGVLPDYGIERAYVEARALAERALDAGSLALPVEPLADEAIAALIAGHEIVLTV